MRTGDVTYCSVRPDGSIGCVSTVDYSIAENCIRQQRSADYARGFRTKVFRSDENKTSQEKFLEFQEQCEAERMRNRQMMQEAIGV